MFLLHNIFLNDTTQKFEKGLLMLYEMTVVNKQNYYHIPMLDARQEGFFLWSYALSNNTTPNQTQSFAMLDALMYFIIRNPNVYSVTHYFHFENKSSIVLTHNKASPT